MHSGLFGTYEILRDFLISLRKPSVISDVKYSISAGLQYIHDTNNDVCLGVALIDANFGDVELVNETTKEIDLKTAADLLMIADRQFYFSEKVSAACFFCVIFAHCQLRKSHFSGSYSC